MVTKMNEPATTVIETLDPVQQNATSIVITLHPQPNRDNICDNNSTTATTTLSNMSPTSCDSESVQASQIMVKNSLKLNLATNENEIKSMDTGSADEDSDIQFKSPTSPRSARNRSIPHQTSLNSTVEIEDRKALRDALYNGIFHRHRRTIFALGSFLRMLKRNPQYNTIRSSSEGEEDAR